MSSASGDAYKTSIIECRNHLRQFALNGQAEASYIIVRETGEKLDFQVGTHESVTPNWNSLEKLEVGQRVTVIHVHFADVGPGPEDWDALALHPQIGACEIVCPNAIFVLQKPEPWPFQVHMKPGFSIMGGAWDRIMHQVRQEISFLDEKFPSPQVADIARIEETNDRFLRSIFARGFTARKLAN